MESNEQITSLLAATCALPGPPSFLALPLELRRMVYSHVLRTPENQAGTHPWRGGSRRRKSCFNPSILLACKAHLHGRRLLPLQHQHIRARLARPQVTAACPPTCPAPCPRIHHYRHLQQQQQRQHPQIQGHRSQLATSHRPRQRRCRLPPAACSCTSLSNSMADDAKLLSSDAALAPGVRMLALVVDTCETFRGRRVNVGGPL